MSSTTSSDRRTDWRAWICLAGVLILAGGAAGTERKSDAERAVALPQNILFVGNSFTYYNSSLHNHVRNLLKAAGLYENGKTRLRALTLSGARLDEHLAGVEAMMARDDWDLVVMHGHSTAFSNARNAKRFDRAAEKLIAHIRSEGATPALMMTWAYENRPEMTEALERGYREAGRRHGVPVIPVGLAFHLARRKHPDIALTVRDIDGYEPAAGGEPVVRYQKSVKHPSEAGTYLAACVVYAALTGRSPAGLPFRAGLSAEHAAALQGVAAQFVYKPRR